MPIKPPQFKYNYNESFDSADKAEQLGEQMFEDRNEFDLAVKAHLELRGQIADLKTRIAALKDLGATINYSKYTTLENELKDLQKIERSQPQISEYLKPIPAQKYAEKPANVNKPITNLENRNPNSIPVNQSKERITQPTENEDWKLGAGIAVGALSLLTIIGLGIRAMPTSEKVAVNNPSTISTPIYDPEKIIWEESSSSDGTFFYNDYPSYDYAPHYTIFSGCKDRDSISECDVVNMKTPKTISFHYHNDKLKKVRIGSGVENFKVINKNASFSRLTPICGVKIEKIIGEIKNESKLPHAYLSEHSICPTLKNYDTLLKRIK